MKEQYPVNFTSAYKLLLKAKWNFNRINSDNIIFNNDPITNDPTLEDLIKSKPDGSMTCEICCEDVPIKSFTHLESCPKHFACK